MAAPMSQKTWEKLRDAFFAGLTLAAAAQASGTSKSTAHRAFVDGVGGRPPIKDLVAESRSALAAAAGDAVRAGAARHLAAIPLGEEVVAEVGAAIEREFVRAAEAATLKASHAASARVMQAWRSLAEIVDELMPEVVKKLRAEFEANKLDARDAVALLDRVASIGTKALAILGAQQDALRTHTSDIGKLEEPLAKRTKADAAEAVTRSERATARAKRRGIALGLEVLPGGASDP